MRQKLSATEFARLDLVGAALLLAASILLVFGFEEAGTRFPWSSATIVATLALGGLLLFVFVLYEGKLDKTGPTKEPMLPLRLFRDRQFLGLVMCMTPKKL